MKWELNENQSEEIRNLGYKKEKTRVINNSFNAKKNTLRSGHKSIRYHEWSQSIIKSKVLTLKWRFWLLEPSQVNLISGFIADKIIILLLSYAWEALYEEKKNTKEREIKRALIFMSKWLASKKGNAKR